MALRLFKNLVITFICSSALVTAGILSTYYIFNNYGVYFDGSLSGLIQWVFMFNAALVIISAPVFLLAINIVRKNLFVRLICYYAFPVAALAIVLMVYVPYDDPVIGMEVWINPIMILVFIAIHSIFFFRLTKRDLLRGNYPL